MRTVYPMDYRHSEDERFFFGAPILGGVLGGVLGGLLVNPPRPQFGGPVPYPIVGPVPYPVPGPMPLPYPGPMPIGPNYIGPNYVAPPMSMPMPIQEPMPLPYPGSMPMPTQPGMMYPQAQPIPYNQEIQVEVNY